ncbi:MMPL family transporter [Actinoallomurus sp. CA-142502]|uniref:MMPL family transporter n=1 Tax=Actinoallomurus sp. CA-142502 TaxID=3239885 RepID=UPI003D8E316E
MGERLASFVSGRRTAWVVLIVTMALGGLMIAFGGSPKVSDDPSAGLSASAESSRAARLQRELPSGKVTAAVIVYARASGRLTGADLTVISAQRAGIARAARGGTVVTPARKSDDGRAATVAVPLPRDTASTELAATVGRVRAAARAGLPPGVTAQVTGPAGITADLAGVFDGANLTLLLTTVAVVALLLIITYRSPWLWLVPLLTVGVADQVTSALVAVLSRHSGLNVSNATVGIVEVLVFGAGTDYALLLIARYREELRRDADRHDAMRRAVRRAGPSIIASGVTVALSLACLLLATLPSNTGIGVASAIGVLCALFFGLSALPAALVICGRGLFWPLVPRADGRDDHLTGRTGGVWARLGRGVARRPRVVAAASIVLLAALAAGLSGAHLGLSQADRFRTKAESIDGLATLSAHFPAGEADPVSVITVPAQAERVLAVVRRSPGVADGTIAEKGARDVRITAVLRAQPDTDASYTAVRVLRDRVHAIPGAEAVVGGTVATDLDTRDAAARDQKVIIPLVLAVVLIILVGLLRALVGPVLLVLTVVASFAAAIGGADFAFTHWLGYPALDTSVPLLAFLFLVALGVDYNIFLVSRAREEATRQGTRAGVLTALAVTGGVITSAGVLLAAVFAVLGVLPLITLTEIGIIVGFGVLLDTLLVRTVLVPALVTILGRGFWWPGRLSRTDGTGEAGEAQRARTSPVG